MQNLVELFFPARCVCCDARIVEPENPYICFHCREKINLLALKDVCSCCGTPIVHVARPGGLQHRCGECLHTAPPFSVARSVFTHKEPIATLIHKLKYQKTSAALAAIKTLLPKVFPEFSHCDLIAPVPLHTNRLQERGFNQSLLLAKASFSQGLSQIRPDLLKRVRNTTPQTTMTGEERRKNLRNAFAVTNLESLDGLSVCLVDDVFTTGSTVSECSLILNSCGAKEVRVLTLSRSPFS